MSGFPARPGRSAFGPTYLNRYPVRDNTRQLDATVINLAMWQLAGAGRCAPLGVIHYDGSADTVTAYAFAFDPNGQLTVEDDPDADVRVEKLGTGTYRVTFAATYQDQRGESVTFVPAAVVPVVQDGASQVAALAAVDGQVATIEIRDENNALLDGELFIRVW